MSDTSSVGSRPDTLYPVTAEAKEYRDLSKKGKEQERRVKIGLIALGVIILIAAIAGVTSLSNTIQASPHFYVQACAVLGALFTGIFGVTLGVTSLGFGIGINYEYGINGFQTPDFKHAGIKSEYTLMFKEGSLANIKKALHKQQGGLRGPVEQGMITPSQADQLRDLFKEMDRVEKALKHFETPLNIKAIANGAHLVGYAPLKERQTAYENKWKEIQEEIKRQYASEPQPEEEVAAIPTPTWRQRAERAYNAFWEDSVPEGEVK